MSLLSVQKLNVQFHSQEKGLEAVQDVSFELEAGEIVGIAGESGSGKSTVMHAILGLLPKKTKMSCKKICFNGEDITPPDLEAGQKTRDIYERRMETVRGDEIAMVFQDPFTYLSPSVKIGRQITETIHAHRNCKKKEAKEQALNLLYMVGIRKPEEKMNQYPFQLSGGIRQRVVIAIALACNPKLLIADEPTTALDATVQRQILELLKNIAEETGTAVLLVSHDLGVLASLSQRILIMQKGKLVEDGDVKDIFHAPKHPYTKELMSQAGDMQKLAKEEKTGEVILRADHVSKTFSDQGRQKGSTVTEAVRDVTFEIREGETFGLVGESGSGKTTLASMAAGMLKPTKGHIFYGQNAGEKGRIQMVFQDPYTSLNPRMTVLKALEEPLLLNTRDTAKKRMEKAEDILKQIGLKPEALEKYPRVFSGGERQRIAIARALILEPLLLICDEPVSALDAATQGEILKLLKEAGKKRRIATLFISHDLNVVKRLSQRIGVMYGGSLVETGNTKDIYKDPWHPYTKALLSSVLLTNPIKARRKKIVLRTEEKAEREMKGCPFASRCGYAMECCKNKIPESYEFGTRKVACFLYGEEYAGRRDSHYKMTSQI